MRPRFAMRAGLLCGALLALAAVPAGAHARGITINAAPNPVTVGDSVFIYGQLNFARHANRRVVLWHRLAGRPRFTPVQITHADANGFYSFTRAPGKVVTNRNWVATVGRRRSRVVHEKVIPEITLNQPATPYITNHPITFTGQVTPGAPHVGERVILQAETGVNGNQWRNIDRGRIGAGGGYSITHNFRQPGERTLRVILRADRFNLRGESTPVDISVEQTQNQHFTINASQQPIQAGASVTLSGTLAAPNNANQTIQLFAHEWNTQYAPVATTMTDANGNYSFTQTPIHNTVYQARAGGNRRTAQVFEGVRDVVTIDASATTSTVGDSVTFTGSVSPIKVGHVIYLQRQGDDGAFHTIAVGTVGALSRYSFTHTFGSPGTKVFRTFVPGGPFNQAGASPAVTITVSPPANATS
jgi:hypothetical protein